MTDLWAKNIAFIREKKPHLLEIMDREEKREQIHCKMVPSRLSGKPGLKLNWNGKEISLHSLYDPVAEARRWVTGLNLEGIRYLGIFGLGLGYHLPHLIQEWPELEKIVVIEPSPEIFRCACNVLDLEQVLVSGKIDIVVFAAGGYEHEEKKIECYLTPLFHLGQLDALDFVEYGPYPRIFFEAYEMVRQICVTLGRKVRINENTILFFSRMWPQNIFANLLDMVTSPGIINLFGKFEGRPGIIVSAGPSLNKNKHLLKQARGKAVVICVGTALRALLKEDIIPDLVITLDGAEANYRHFEGLRTGEIPLVFVPTAHYKILEEHKGLKFVVGGGNPLIDWTCQFIETKGLLNFGGSVAHAAFDLALRMGCNPVILVGQDLAYTGGESHARGTVYEGKKISEDGGKFYVEDVFGGRVLTDHVLNDFRDWFEKAIALWARGRLVIDATEGGARIAGTEIMALKEVLEKYCQSSFPVTATIYSAATMRIPSEDTVNRVLAAMEDALKDLGKLEILARKGVKLATELGTEYDKKNPEFRKTRKLLRRLERIDAELLATEANTLLNVILQPVLLAVTKGPLAHQEERETERDFAQRVAARSVLLYEGIREAAKQMQNFITEAYEKLKRFMT
ncbi:motility associated factor glycosyltransferase family protein [Neomoorella thermoacetica]|uniref:motility associated factor glycosyltransferase family protein n=1 Tax=Neomoorella thermoacetica TaxID=1525 RepID=UPI0008FAC7FA|nr:6-hydroxymethylpterin diphosphokinase MptE-like protein [Moorella thermoacetica]OIQ12534.1 hypothetical protein MOOTH_05330 [Moorella thermoacetica]